MTLPITDLEYRARREERVLGRIRADNPVSLGAAGQVSDEISLMTDLPWGGDPIAPYRSIAAVIGAVILVGVVILVLAHTIGPKRKGPVKDATYESGMPAIKDARQRFNVRFYLVAMLFLLFDVEVVFLWPWARVFADVASRGTSLPLGGGAVADKTFLFMEMLLFGVILMVGYVYAWRKGVFEWD